MSNIKYLFGIRSSGRNKAEVHLVQSDYWAKNHKKYPRYIPDNSVANTLENKGFIECMENVYEFNTSKISVSKAKEILMSLGNMEHSVEFESTLH